MRSLLSVAIIALLSLTACTSPHPPLRYVERHYHHMPRKPYYASTAWEDSRLYRSWQRRQAEIAGDMSYHHGCYRGWC